MRGARIVALALCALAVKAACTGAAPYRPPRPSQPRESAFGEESVPAFDTTIWRTATAELVFMSTRDGPADVYVTRGSNGTWWNLTRHEAADNWPEWSPDGRRIAFQSTRSGNLDIWLMDADGSAPVQLTTDPAPDGFPAWSPDGRRLLFTSWRSEPGDVEPAAHLYVMDADGAFPRRLPVPALGTSAGATFSPDGSRIVYVRRPEGSDSTDVFVADADGGHERRLTDSAASEGAPVFSPDGDHIAFHAASGDLSEIVTLAADGTRRRVIVSWARAFYPRWSPDGRWLLYTAAVPEGQAGDLDLWTVPSQGGESSPLLVGPGREAEGRWRSRR